MKALLNKSFITNSIAILVIILGYCLPVYDNMIKNIGFFALSGAVTNWIAIHMLFEKVPFLYGSGIIPNRFEEFKASIKELMMNQFFTLQNIQLFIEKEEQEVEGVINLEPLLAVVDYDRIFAGLISSIMESSFGEMLQMMGGEAALEPLKEPFTDKMKLTLTEMVESDKFKTALKQGLDAHKIGEDIVDKIETVIDNRLAELTPDMVKEMVQKIIREHLGWLVVWGGLFGGIIGGIFSFV